MKTDYFCKEAAMIFKSRLICQCLQTVVLLTK